MSGDLFGDEQIPNLYVKPPREWPEPEAPGVIFCSAVWQYEWAAQH
ncbi:MAG TPA: hypothetical protein VFI37_14275 [Gaiellaceae bacterium]|nr:hypothetical protein [Gaiellaceae bacterium]